jgi:hypothetical protein
VGKLARRWRAPTVPCKKRRPSHAEILDQFAGLHDRFDFGLRDRWNESPPSSAGCAEIRPPPSATAPPEPVSKTFLLRGTPRPPSENWPRIEATSRCASLARRRRRPAPLRPFGSRLAFCRPAECWSSASCTNHVDMRRKRVSPGLGNLGRPLQRADACPTGPGLPARVRPHASRVDNAPPIRLARKRQSKTLRGRVRRPLRRRRRRNRPGNAQASGTA